MEDGLDEDTLDSALRIVDVSLDEAGERLDKVLAGKLSDMSRGTVQRLMERGMVTLADQPQRDLSAKAQAGLYYVAIPAPDAAEPEPEAIPLNVLFEDAHLIVINKAAGMAAHPAPGTHRGTLVNALLSHCGDSLSGIGGVARPGIVHRLDKLTSGVMVAAKTDVAHAGLSKLFAAHDIERAYVAFVRGAPNPARGRIENQLGRSSSDRKKIAVLRNSGRLAITDYKVEKAFGAPERILASRVICRLHTGRTHQIRVHMASKGTPVLGDPVYGSGGTAPPLREILRVTGLDRQALHAAVLGFIHPVTGEALRFETPLPDDLAALETALERLG